MTRLRDMSQDQLIEWISTLPFSDGNKSEIIKGIKEAAVDFGDPVTGEEFFDAEDVWDIKELTAKAIDRKLARSLLVEINKKKGQDFNGINNKNKKNDNNNNKGNDSFTLIIVAQQGGMVKIENVTKSWKVSQVKAEYLEDQGDLVTAAKYRKDVKLNRDKIELIKSGKVMHNDRTLEDYGITSQLDAIMPLAVLFKAFGGGPFEYNKEWKIMYQQCPVCICKRTNNLKKGYWSHPGGNKAEFKSSQPGPRYAVETKEDKIRCSSCKNECNQKDWIYKCPNHDYQKIDT